MAFITLPLGLRVVLEFNANGEPVVNVVHVTTGLVITIANLTLIAEAFEDWFSATYRINFAPELEMTGVVVTDISVENGIQKVLPSIPPIPGTGALNASPNNVAGVVSMRTPQTGRSFRGRSYAAGLSRGEISGNTMTAARAAAIAGSWPTLATSLTALSTVIVVASFQAGGVPRVVGVATPVDTFVVNTRVDTQRRRLPA